MTKRWLAVVLIVAASAAGCKKKGAATGMAGSADPAAGSAASGSGDPDGAAPIAATPVDDAQAAQATASAALATASRAHLATVEPTARAEAAGRLVDATVAALRRGSREAWDPAAVVATVGADRDALFAWVRDRTALVPYRGSLRGAAGVLMDRVGNSLDRALLLAALLDKAGLSARLASATLDAGALARLAASWRGRARPEGPPVLDDDPALLDQLIAELGVDAAGFRATVDQHEVAHRDVLARTATRITAQVATLGALVPAPVPPPAPGPDESRALAEHWWVQVQAADGGSWIDLDPSLPDAVPGTPLAAAPTTTVAVGELPAELRHTLTVRVIGEVWHGQVRAETPLVEHTFAPADYYGQRIIVTTLPIDMPTWDALIADPHPAATARAALASQTEWVPVLRIGAGIVAQKSVTDGGEVFEIADPSGATRLARAVQRATKAGVGGATDLLGQLPDDPAAAAPAPQPPAAPTSGFTAAWIEYELRSPGAPSRVIRRPVFDALGTADRATAKPIQLTEAARFERGLALIGEAELLPMFAAIPEAFVADRTAAALEELRAPLVELAGLGGQPPSIDLVGRLTGATPAPGPVYSLALARFGWSPVGRDVYLDRLNLLIASHRVVTVGAGVRWRDVLDLAANAVAIWPAGTAVADPRAVRLTQGIVDTAAEAVIIRCPRGSNRCLRGVNTSDALAAGSAPWTVVTSAAAPELARWPAPTRTLAAADLAAGYVLVVPPGDRPARTWWRIDPRSGESLGMGDLGGDSSVELAILNAGLISGGGFITAAGCVLSFGLGNSGLAGLAACMAAVGNTLVGAHYALGLAKNRALVIACFIVASAFGLADQIVPSP